MANSLAFPSLSRLHASEIPQAPVCGGRYRVIFATRLHTGTFHDRACYTVDSLSPTQVRLRGYAQVLARTEVVFLPVAR
jgi:hypothetical protein